VGGGGGRAVWTSAENIASTGIRSVDLTGLSSPTCIVYLKLY